jgi:uncharacterized protein YecT (DUF1311 family)
MQRSDFHQRHAGRHGQCVYQESLKKLKPEQAAFLKKAQRAWLTYRDAECEADYKMSAGDTAAPLALTQSA